MVAEKGKEINGKDPIQHVINGQMNGSKDSLPKANGEFKELDLKKSSSIKELEALGLERLKVELMKHGLKCGGTLAERSARLFLLTHTPLSDIPKKHLAAPPKIRAKKGKKANGSDTMKPHAKLISCA